MVVRGQVVNLQRFYVNFSTRKFLGHNPKKYALSKESSFQ